MAAGVLEKMLGEARWRNVMMLHQGVAVYEVRNGRGYGMRWTLELEDNRQATARLSTSDDVQDGEDVEGRREEVSSTPNETDNAVNVETTSDEHNAEGWIIKKTTFRGFLEPIAEMDHELELEN